MNDKKKYIFIALSLFIGFVLGNITGFFAGALSVKSAQDFFQDVFSGEEAADIEHQKTITRNAFIVRYPGNWKVAMDDEDYDADSNFSIENVGSSFVHIFVFDEEIDPEETLKSEIDEFRKLLKNPVTTRFAAWGKFKGQGTQMDGKIMGFKTTVRIFCAAQKPHSLLIVEFLNDKPEDVLPGFKLIQDTFAFNHKK